MSECVRLPPLPDSGDVLRSMSVIPYLEDMYHGSDDDYDPRDPDEIDEHVIAITEGIGLDVNSVTNIYAINIFVHGFCEFKPCTLFGSLTDPALLLILFSCCSDLFKKT